MISFTASGASVVKSWIKHRKVPTQMQIFRSAGVGALTALPFVAYSAANARYKEKLSTFAGGTAGMIAYPGLAALTTWGLGGAAQALSFLAPPPLGAAIRVSLAAAGLVLATKPADMVDENVFRAVRAFSRFDGQMRRLEMGFGAFRESEQSQMSRLAALNELSSAFQPARSYLGREAMLLHR